MSKNSIFILVATLVLVASVLFSFMQKRAYEQSLSNINYERQELKKIVSLKSLWGAKGLKSKIEKVLNTVPSSKQLKLKIKRGKAEFKFNSLSDVELNRVLSKLAKLPVQFKNLLITRSGDQFIMECKCVW